MSVSVEQLEEWMRGVEDEHLEFKEAKNQYSTEKPIRYCAALANEGGGKMVLGVTDKKPRRVVGTRAFAELNDVKAKLVDRLRLRIEVTVIEHPDGRVLVFEIPSRPIGMPVACDGTYLMRAGEDLVSMTPDMLGRIFDEAGPDFSAEICPKATLDDLDPRAVENMREMWVRKSGNEALYNLNREQLLTDAELLVGGEVTYAALVLLGTRRALGRHLAQSEVIFEYRSNEAYIPFQQRGLARTLPQPDPEADGRAKERRARSRRWQNEGGALVPGASTGRENRGANSLCAKTKQLASN